MQVFPASLSQTFHICLQAPDSHGSQDADGSRDEISFALVSKLQMARSPRRSVPLPLGDSNEGGTFLTDVGGMEATALSPRKDARSTARNPPPKSKDGAGKKPTAAASPTPASKGAPDRISRAQSVEELVEVPAAVAWYDAASLDHEVANHFNKSAPEETKAVGLLIIREAARNNIKAVVARPGYLDHLLTALFSRSKLMRPCAAAAIAAVASHRPGREALLKYSRLLLPRLVAMMRCGVWSLDAAYAALVVANWSLLPACKELISRGDTISVLVSLIRRCILVPDDKEIATLKAQAQNSNSRVPIRFDTFRGSRQNPDGLQQLQQQQQQFDLEGGTVPVAPQLQQLGRQSGTGDAGSRRGTPLIDVNLQRDSATGAAAGGQEQYEGRGGGGSREQPCRQDGRSERFARRTLDSLGFGEEEEGGQERTATSLYIPDHKLRAVVPRPAAVHAVTALLNAVDVPSNRQLMEEAGLAEVVAQALCCPKLNVLTERCRLLGGWLGFTELRMAAVRQSSESLGRKSKSKRSSHKAGQQQQQQKGVARASKGQDGPRSSSLLRALSVDPPQPERLHEVVQEVAGPDIVQVALELGALMHEDDEAQRLLEKVERKRRRREEKERALMEAYSGDGHRRSNSQSFRKSLQAGLDAYAAAQSGQQTGAVLEQQSSLTGRQVGGSMSGAGVPASGLPALQASPSGRYAAQQPQPQQQYQTHQQPSLDGRGQGQVPQRIGSLNGHYGQGEGQGRVSVSGQQVPQPGRVSVSGQQGQQGRAPAPQLSLRVLASPSPVPPPSSNESPSKLPPI